LLLDHYPAQAHQHINRWLGAQLEYLKA